MAADYRVIKEIFSRGDMAISKVTAPRANGCVLLSDRVLRALQCQDKRNRRENVVVKSYDALDMDEAAAPPRQHGWV